MAGFKDGGLYFSKQNSVNNPLSSDKVLLYVNLDGDIMARYSTGSEVNLTETFSVTGFITRTEVANVTGQLTDRIDNLAKSDINDFVEGDYVHTTGDEGISGIKTFNDDVFINGSLTVAGSATYIDVTDLRIEDNVIIVNRNESGDGVTLNYSGIEIERGTSPNVGVVWSESAGKFGATTGSTSASPTFEAFALESDVAFISGAVDQNASDISQLFVDVSVVSGAVDQNASDISQLFVDVSVVSGAVDDLSVFVDAVSAAIPTSFLDLNDTPSTYPASSAGFFIQVNSSEDGLEYTDFRTEVITISSSLASSIYQNTLDIGQISSEVAVNTATIGDHENRIDVLESQTSALTGSLGSMVIGILPLNTVDKVYTINHPVTPVLGSVPMVSLTVPGSGSELLVDGVINRTTSSFDVVLSGTPEVSGYSLNWMINMAGDAFIVKYYNVGTLSTPEAYPDAVGYDTFYLELDQDSTLNAPSSMVNGQTINIMVEQDSTGGWVLDLSSDYEYSGGIASFSVSPSAGSVDILTVVKIRNRLFVSAVQNLA